MSLIVASTSAAPVTTLKQQDGHCPKFGSYFETAVATHYEGDMKGLLHNKTSKEEQNVF